jgi:hypothetical protein
MRRRRRGRRRRPGLPAGRELGLLVGLHLVADPQDVQLVVGVHRAGQRVDADDLLVALLQRALVDERGLGDLAGEPAVLDAAQDARGHRAVGAHVLDAGEDLLRLALDLVGERLDVPGAAERVGDVEHAGLLHDHLLGAQRDLGGLGAGQREHLVEGVGVQRLGAAEDGGQRLDRRPDDVVVRLLGGQRDAGGLGVEAQLLRLLRRRAVDVAQPAGPDPAGGAELGDLLEEVDVRVEEERQPGANCSMSRPRDRPSST